LVEPGGVAQPTSAAAASAPAVTHANAGRRARARGTDWDAFMRWGEAFPDQRPIATIG